MRDERLLHRIERLASSQTFYGSDLAALLHHGESHARQHAPAIYVNRARATLAVIAAFLRPSDARVFAQRVEQRHSWFESQRDRFSIDVERDRLRRDSVRR